jgi:histidinol-phosphate aminotransferase
MRFNPALDDIVPYEPGRPIERVQREFGLEEVVKLASNEYPLPPFPEVQTAIMHALGGLQRYPDGHTVELRAALGRKYGRSPDEIVIGNGSCELLLYLGHALLGTGDEVVYARPSFSIYRLAALLQGARPVEVPLRDHTHDLDAMLAAVGPRTRMVVVCNPNNPTGTYLPATAVAEFVDHVPADVLVVLDEAYNEFVDRPDWQDTLPLLGRHDNLIVLRTFSKIYGLCGLRVGYGLCASELKSALDKVRQPFNVNRLAQVAALEALRHDDQMLARRAQTIGSRAVMVAELQELGRPLVPSEANFMLVGTEGLRIPQEDVWGALLAQGAIVRDGNALGCPGWIRVSVGTREEMDFFLARFRTLLEDDRGRPN